MPNSGYSIFDPEFPGREIFRRTVASENSLRGPTGQLLLRANPHDFVMLNETQVSGRGTVDDTPSWIRTIPGTNGVFLPSMDDSALYNRAYASFTSKIHKGDASLGVTLASWRQSADMVATRLQQANRVMRSVKSSKDARALQKGLGRAKERPLGTAANSNLEWDFGWKPLFQDIHSAASVVMDPLPPVYIKGAARGLYTSLHQSGGFYEKQDQVLNWKHRYRIAAIADVTNPNLFLLNRLGLINPAVVAWDVIPWSFVVGMFANVNQILKSFTDFVGLELRDMSITRSQVGYYDLRRFYANRPDWPYESKSHVVWRRRNRTVGGSLPRPSLEFKIPDLSWNTALMFASLAVQQATRVLKLLR